MTKEDLSLWYKHEQYKMIIDNHKGTKYYVSRAGKVISKKVHIHELKVFETNKGYQYVKTSTSKGKSRAEFIHRLVAKAFIPNPDNKPEVNHIDGNKHNNCVENLEWVTSKENKDHARNHHLIRPAKGEKSGMTNLTNNKVRAICEDMERNELTIKELSKKYNVTKDTLYSIRTRRAWTFISEDYYFPKKTKQKYKFSENTIRKMCKMFEQGYTSTQVSKKLGINKSTANDIYKHRRHTDISNDYDF